MSLARTLGRFDRLDGMFLIDPKDPGATKVTVTLDTGPVNSNHAGRDAHVRSEYHLGAGQFSAITVRTEDVEMRRPTGGNLHGTLTLPGQSRPLPLDFEPEADRTCPALIPNFDEVRVVSFAATAEVLRPDHGMDLMGHPGSPTGPSIDLDIHADLIDCAVVPDTNVPCHEVGLAGFDDPHQQRMPRRFRTSARVPQPKVPRRTP